MHASYVDVPAGRNGAIAGSPAVPLVKLTSAPSGPAHAAECPFVNTIPLLIASGVPAAVNLPLATPAQVSVGDNTVTPAPASAEAKTVAGCDVVTTN